jgi:hypothetical protein
VIRRCLERSFERILDGTALSDRSG